MFHQSYLDNKLNSMFVFLCLLVLISGLFFSNGPTESVHASPANSSPVLFFSDLTWGPKTGWEGSTTKGAAVSIWGKNFGTSRGTNYVTVNGADLMNNADYAEWGVTGIANGVARGMERITFWLNSSATDGTGAITVTVNGVTSNALPFTITNGAIYFISVTDGNNSNNGRYASAQGGSNGPFKDLWKFNPCGSTDPMHTTGSCNPSQDGQYIVYVRRGTYTDLDVDASFIALRGPYGGPTKQKALIGYPGEMPVMNTANADRGIAWNAAYDPYGFNDYFTFAKLTGINGGAPFWSFGSYNRFVGNVLKDYLEYAQAGIIQVTNSKYTSIFGNIFDHNGNDSMKHNIYIKTEYTGLGGNNNFGTLYTYVGWNEFINAVSSDTHGGVIFISKSGDTQIANYATDYVYIHDNYFHDGSMDFIYFGDNINLGGNMYVYNNTFKGNTSSNGGITIHNGSSDVYFYNNTFYQMGPTDGPMAWQTGNSRSYWKNNIWYTSNGQMPFYLETYKGATANFDHDLFFNGSAPSGSGITVTNTVSGDPKFVSAATADFHLQSDSPAIDAGTSAVNSIVSADYENIARPQGNGFDLGAHEYLTGSVNPPVQTCSDGTTYGSCSVSKPQYCNNGTLVSKASTCGCPTGQTVSGDTCVTPAQTCSDGTTYGSCSVSKPQ
ncbi:MAG TPA: choice-of-anchor Q domain-containing protein, partial [Patescibacteria group bacterium]|nr:choice-of-anchor Q domain-containing protein [Patescibacteria group bacterium]